MAHCNDALSGRGNVKCTSLLEVDDSEVLQLAKSNAHPRDSNISFFEDDHRYEVKGVPVQRSVTSLVGIPFSKFDAKSSAMRIAQRLVVGEGCGSVPIRLREPRTKSDVQYCEMARKTKATTSAEVQRAIRSVWERSTHEGTRLHRAIELHLNGEAVPESYTAPEYRNHYLKDFLEYIKEEKFECYRTEWVIYSDEVSIAGSVDCVMRKRVGTDPNTGEAVYEYYIFDWKRSKKIYFKSFGDGGRRMGKGKPFDTLIDCNFSKYSLQLNVYRHMLERDYKLDIKGLYLFVFHPWNDTFVKIEVPRMDVATKALFCLAKPPITVLIPPNYFRMAQSFPKKELNGDYALKDLEERLGDYWTRSIKPEINNILVKRDSTVNVYVASSECSDISIITQRVQNINKVTHGASDTPTWSF